MICFGCGEVGHFVAKCPNKSDGNSKGKKGFKKSNKQGKKKGSKRNFLSKEDSSSSYEESDSKEEANEKVLFMAKHNKQEVSNNEEEGLTIEEFYEEAIKLIKELKAENICSNTLEEQVQGLKIEVEEHKYIEESLQKKLEESNQEREALEAEAVSLCKEVKKGKIVENYANNSRELEELINNQRSYNGKTGLGYQEEEAVTSKTKYNEPMRYDMHVDFIGQDSQEHNWKIIPRRRFPFRYQHIFHGYCYLCGKFGHKAVECHTTLGTNTIPGDSSNMNLQGLNETSIDLNI